MVQGSGAERRARRRCHLKVKREKRHGARSHSGRRLGAAGTSRPLLPVTCWQVSCRVPHRAGRSRAPRALTIVAAVPPVVGHGARPGCTRGVYRSAVDPAGSQGFL